MIIKELDQHCGECGVIDYCGNPYGYCLCHDKRFSEIEEEDYKRIAEEEDCTVIEHELCENAMVAVSDCSFEDIRKDYVCEQIANFVETRLGG